MEHVVIIGNGISGVTCARYIRKQSDKRITIISSETKHFFSRTALMYVYMGHMKYENIKPYEDWFWKKNKIDLKQDRVKEIAFSKQELILESGETLAYDKLALALGSKPRIMDWPGKELNGVQGLYSYQDLESMEAYSPKIKQVVIVGGGLIGVEMAEMFHSRHIPVIFLVREDRFWGSVLPKEEGQLISDHLQAHGIDLRFNEELEEIIGDKDGACKAIHTKNGKEIACDFVGLTIGVQPNISFLEGSELEIDNGILVNSTFQTNIDNVYAIGDCIEMRNPSEGRKAIEQVWYTGRMHGEVAANNICGKHHPFQPGPWFNSAKFFDLEYQTYGQVAAEPQENEERLYWHHDNGRKALHLVFNKNTFEVIGINLIGIRHRHELWDKWLRNKTTVPEVLNNLRDANFDPEFETLYEGRLVEQFNSLYPDKSVVIKKKKRLLEKLGFSS